MKTLIIARHGNTFESGEPPRRVGARTDLPLTAKGVEQGKSIGLWLAGEQLIPDLVVTSPLQRTIMTADAAMLALGRPDIPRKIHDFLTEIDYGPDENQTEDKVVARIGQQALTAWDTQAILPDGWLADPQAIIDGWRDFAETFVASPLQTIMAVTSNGTARFAPEIAGNVVDFRLRNDIKLATGALGILRYDAGMWIVTGWNIRPPAHTP